MTKPKTTIAILFKGGASLQINSPLSIPEAETAFKNAQTNGVFLCIDTQSEKNNLVLVRPEDVMLFSVQDFADPADISRGEFDPRGRPKVIQ